MEWQALSLFSGIGGIDYAFEAAGFRIIEQVEIDDYCRRVLTQHWPAVPKHRDIFDYHGQPGSADVITAGFPCQPFSMAGKQRGRDDERFLWPQLYRVIAEVRPLVVFLENVPGLRTNDDGRTFKRILWELAEVGYDAEWGHLQAAHVGAPHKRERIFVVAYAIRTERKTCRPDGMGTDEQTEPFARAGALAYAESPERERRGNTRSGRHGFTDGDQTLVDAAIIRCNGHSTRSDGAGTGEAEGGLPQFTRIPLSLAHAQQQRSATGTPRQTRPAFRYRQRQHQAAQLRRHEQQPRSADTGVGAVESGLGRSTDGLSARLVGHRFPAPPGAFQYDFEAPRTAQGVAGRTNQLKALGNAVVPQVVYPVALAIREWLEG